MRSIDELLEQLDHDRVRTITHELISIPSVNPFGQEPGVGLREQEVGLRYAELLTEVGCEVVVDEVTPGRPNVIGVLKGSRPGPTLLLTGHLDTVGVTDYHDPFTARIEDGRLYGRGSCDMKAALAAFIEVARVINEQDVPFAGELMIAGIADEEDRMIGSVHWSNHGPVPDFAVVGEPTSLKVCPAHKGQYGAKFRTFGTAVHSSIRGEGVNAIEKMADLIAGFADYNDELDSRPAHPLCGNATFSIGTISGGEVMSTVPDFCEIEADRRMIPGETVDQVLAEYDARLQAVAAADPEFRYELDGPTMSSAVLDTPLDHPIVTTVVEETETVLGTPAIIEAFTGATDAPNFHCPAVIMGPGSIAQAHTLDEFVPLAELEAATEIYLRVALSLLS